ncbi:MAG: hypothetical protein WHV66_03700 [Anaerolineales bacterium]|jgi:hypothetical protein
MKIISNEKLIKRNRKIGQITTFASLAILAAGLVASFSQNYFNLSFAALLLGFVLSQVGIYFGSRWGRSPRPDEKLSQALKGLDDKYFLYHYKTSVPHLLVGPAGIWILMPYPQGGTIYYDTNKDRWKQKGGSLYLKIFAQEGLGRPDLEAQSYELETQKYLRRFLGNNIELPPIQPILVFTNEKTVVQSENAPMHALNVTKLKDFIRHQAKANPAPMDSIKIIQQALPTE